MCLACSGLLVNGTKFRNSIKKWQERQSKENKSRGSNDNIQYTSATERKEQHKPDIVIQKRPASKSESDNRRFRTNYNSLIAEEAETADK